jgi:hypothetical protein
MLGVGAVLDSVTAATAVVVAKQMLQAIKVSLYGIIFFSCERAMRCCLCAQLTMMSSA